MENYSLLRNKGGDIILLSLDASMSNTGYAIFEKDKLIHYGKISTKKSDFNTEDERINYICDRIRTLIVEYEIDNVSCEDQFTSINAKTILTLRKLIGAIVRTSNEFDIQIKYMLPASWRKELGINKGKSKDKKLAAYNYLIEHKVVDFEFRTSGKNKTDDICDAICIGLAYLKSKGE